MAEAEEPARAILGSMLEEAWQAAKSASGSAPHIGVPRATVNGWRRGETAPAVQRSGDFWSVVRQLEQAAGRAIRTEAQWAAALLAAQQEGTTKRYGQLDLVREGQGFVAAHGPALDVATEAFRGRTGERSLMNAFVTDPDTAAPSYLCWHADLPVGKTTLLADYVRRRRPRGTDILSFFVSATHGTDSRAVFETEIARQISVLLRKPPEDRVSVPTGVRQWNRLFGTAADTCVRAGRRLLLVVDGLDDDTAWSGPVGGGGGQPTASGGRTTRDPARGSIAALLPASPPPGMRVIVSFRRCERFPDDLSARHPLRRRTHLRALAPVAGVPLVQRTPPGDTALGRTVAGLLAVAGGGLRTPDLAELAECPVEQLDRMVQGPEGRFVVLDDPVLQTYAPADHGLTRAVVDGLGHEEVARYTRTLLTWSKRWRTAGWPDGTPPYPLAHQLRLLTGVANRAAYVLDIARLRRLAATVGQDAALAQLDGFEAEIVVAGPTSDSLGVLVPLAAARALMRGESRDVPFGAPAVLVRLGDVERACGLARSAPTAAARAVHLADVAVELTYAGREEADAIAREAAGWLTRADRHSPDTGRHPETYARVLDATRALVSLDRLTAARPLLRAVASDPVAGIEVLTEAAGMLVAVREPKIATVLFDRAETLSEGSTRARAAAIDIWGAVARAMPSLGSTVRDRIRTLCTDLDPSDGLGAVDVLALAASALSRLRAKRDAGELTRRALALVFEALADPDALSEHDQAHLGRELAGTLVRLVQAVHDTMSPMTARDYFEQLWTSLPEQLRIGVLGDVVPERAQSITDADEQRRAQEARDAAATAKEKKNADRRVRDAERHRLAEEAAENRAASREKKQAARGLTDAGRDAPAATRGDTAEARTDSDGSPLPIRPASTPRRTPRHRASTGLRRFGDSPPPDHERLLQEADEQLAVSNLVRCRELLESTLRQSPAPSSYPPVPEGWTVHLSEALGAAGSLTEAEALAEDLPTAQDLVRRLAALSLGCSLGGYQDAADRYAHEAARLAYDGTDPDLRNVVAQALAHVGDEAAASAMVTGRNAAKRRQALTAVAAGLVRHCPLEAARIASRLTEELMRLMERDPLQVLPSLAALLLAFPDTRRPDPGLRDALRLVLVRVAEAPQTRRPQARAVLAVLERLGLLPEEDAPLAERVTDDYQRSLPTTEASHAELALLSAIVRDTPGLWRHAEAAQTPDGRAAALYAAAAHLAGGTVALATDSRAGDRVIRTCLALARTSGGDNGSSAQTTARRIVRKLLVADAWAHAIPLLPRLAPGALPHLVVIAKDAGQRVSRAGQIVR